MSDEIEYYLSWEKTGDKDCFYISSPSSLAVFISPKPPHKVCTIERETIFGVECRFDRNPKDPTTESPTGEWRHIDRFVFASFHECDDHMVWVRWTEHHFDEKGHR